LMSDQMNESDVLKQVEHYFGDANMRKDKWLRAEAAKDAEGFVDISHICKFNRMKSLNATDITAVADVMAKSDNLVVSEDKTKVRRKNPLPTEDDSDERTVYMKGFPEDSALEDLQAYVAGLGDFKVLMVTMRRLPNKKFKGSVFVELSTVDEAKAVCAMTDLKFKESALEVKSKGSWQGERLNQRKQDKLDKEDKKRKASEVEEQEKADRRVKYMEELKERQIPENRVLKVENLPSTASVVGLKGFLNTFQKVEFVEHEAGETTALVRFEADCSQVVAKCTENKYDDATLTATVLTPDQSRDFWTKAWTDMYDKKERMNSLHSRGDGGGRGGGRGRGRGRGGRGGGDRKRQRTE